MLRAGRLARAAGDAFVGAAVFGPDHFEVEILRRIRVVQREIVPYLENAGDVHAVGTGHAIAAVRAADLRAAVVRRAHIVHQLQLFRGHDAGVHRVEDPQVLLDLLGLVAAGQHDRHLRVVAQPAEAPLDRSALHRERVIERLHVRGRLGQPAAEKAFHDHDRDAFAAGQFQALRARLVVDVHVVVLDLAHVPVVVVQDVLEFLVRAVEREALVADLSRLLHVVKKLRRPDLFKMLPFLPVQRVHQVEIDVVSLKLLQF